MKHLTIPPILQSLFTHLKRMVVDEDRIEVIVDIEVGAGVVGVDGGAVSIVVAVSEVEGEDEVGEAVVGDGAEDFVAAGAVEDVVEVSEVEATVIMVDMVAMTTMATTITHNHNPTTTPLTLYPQVMSIELSKLKLDLLLRLLERAARIFT